MSLNLSVDSRSQISLAANEETMSFERIYTYLPWTGTAISSCPKNSF
jgi:hypothetical protein